jgi:hypothetical protein
MLIKLNLNIIITDLPENLLVFDKIWPRNDARSTGARRNSEEDQVSIWIVIVNPACYVLPIRLLSEKLLRKNRDHFGSLTSDSRFAWFCAGIQMERLGCAISTFSG